MNVKRSDQDGIAILELTGEFDSFETELVREGFDQCLREGHRSVVIDLSGMTFANSTTLAYFITAHNRAAKEGGRLLLVRPNDFILKTMHTLGLQQLLRISDSVEDAVAALNS